MENGNQSCRKKETRSLLYVVLLSERSILRPHKDGMLPSAVWENNQPMLLLFRIVLALCLAAVAVSQTIPSSGCVFHLRASLGITLVGDKVSEWESQCGDPIVNFTQSEADERPKVDAEAMGGRDVVKFTATDNRLGPVGTTIGENDDRTFIVVIEPDDDGGAGPVNSILFSKSQDHMIDFGSFNPAGAPREDGLRLKNGADAGDPEYYSPDGVVPAGEPVIFMITQWNGGTSLNAWTNGASILDITGTPEATTFAYDLSSVYLGEADSGTIGTRSFVGDVAEVILYDRVLTNAEFSSVLQELGTHYNVPTHPFDGLPASAGGGGDPHFMTWTGNRFDYHGECDLVFLYDPFFDNGKGLRIHLRTTRHGYYSFIERVALQIGNDVLEFAGIQDWYINGIKARPKPRLQKFAKYLVRIHSRAMSVRIDESKKVKIDFSHRKNGFLYLSVDANGTNKFRRSLGLLGDGAKGQMMARDGITDLSHDANVFATEWQVRDFEPQLFQTRREPQYPAQCRPPEKMLENRLGMPAMRKRAEKACQKRPDEVEECIFDVLATRKLQAAAF